MPPKNQKEVTIRKAVVTDAEPIQALLKKYSQQELLLPRPLSEIYALIPQFFVAELNNEIIGCAALEVFSEELGEVRSLAVSEKHNGAGLGKCLTNEVENYATMLGLKKMMALTYVDQFFHKLGYETVSMAELPEKVWSVCVKCPKFHHCDEIPVLKYL